MSNTPSPTLEQRLTRWVTQPKWWFVAAAALLAVQIKWWWSPGADDSAYLSMANHFAHGEMRCFGSSYLRYTTGYPLIIAPCFWLSQRPFLAISIVHALLGGILAAGTWQWARRLAPTAAPLIVLWVVANAGWWQTQARTLSEVLYAPILVWGAVLLQRLADPSRADWRRWAWLIPLSVLLIGFGGWVRQTMALLVGGFCIVLSLQARRGERTWRSAIVLGVVVTVSVGAVIGVAAAIKVGAIDASGDPAGYFFVPTADSWPLQVLETFRIRMSEIGRVTVPFMIQTYAEPFVWLNINIPIFLAAFGLIVFGWWRAVRSHRDVLLWLMPFHAAFFLVWPFEAGVRYTVVVLPVLALCVWKLVEPWRQSRLSIVFVLVVMHAIGSIVWYASKVDQIEYQRDWPAIDELAELLHPDPNNVRLLGVSGKHKNMLTVSLNRAAPRIFSMQGLEDYGGMLVLGDAYEPPDGFVSRGRVEALGLTVFRHASSPIPPPLSPGELRPAPSK